MSDQRNIEQLISLVRQMQWPVAQRTSMQTRRIYERGLDEINAFSGDPVVYGNALNLFRQSDSCAYAYAGVAYTLAHVSWLNRKVDATGINEAMVWLEKAQEWERDRIEINFIEAFIYIISGELDNGRIILDHLGRQNAQYFHYCAMELLYWDYRQKGSNFRSWFEKALNHAGNPMQQAHVFSTAGSHFLHSGQFKQSIKLYKEVVKLKPDDAWAWHNMSVMLVKMDDYSNASLCNQKALSIMDFGAARRTEQEIQEYKKMSSGRLGRLFGR